MNKRTSIIAALCCLACLSVQAQQTWSLKQCIDYAVEHNVSIKQAANSVEQNAVEVNTAKWARLPSLSGSAGQGWSWGRTQTAVKDEESGDYSTVYVNSNSNNTSMSLNASVPLFTGMELPSQYALSKLNLKAAMADLGKAKEDLAINIASSYLQARLAELGKASLAEVAEAKARVAQDELSSVQARNDHRLALLNLSQLIELDTPEGFQLETPQVDIELRPLYNPDEIFQTALNEKSSIQAAQYRLEGSKYSIKLAQSGFYPRLNLNGSLGTSYYSTINRTFRQQMGDNFSKYVGLSLSVPLFNRFETRNRVRSARLQRENYALQLEDARKTLYKEIQQAWYNATAAESKFTSSNAAAEASAEAFRLTNEKYNNGQATAVEYNEAKQNLLKAQSDELQAKYDYLFRTKILDFYAGLPIE